MSEISHKKANSLIQASMGGRLSGVEKEALAGHLKTCALCRTNANQMATLEADLRQIFHTCWDSLQPSPSRVIDSVHKKMMTRILYRKILNIAGAVEIGMLLLVVILFSVSILPEQTMPGGVGITPTRVFQDTQQIPNISTTPAAVQTMPAPDEKNTQTQVITYTVQAGDTLYGIAQEFNLTPETILWGNPDTFVDPPYTLKPGIILNILPVDGAYHRWKAGEDLNDVAMSYEVSPQVIVNWPGNHLDPQTLGDYSNPRIEPGTMLVIPGGKQPFIDIISPKN